ncbi:uncharacterized protein LOC131236318 isoform X3 [Magnolia sinica]|uniref:uncharacterized protein LOC131236318 isoform X3 n=2 Tax=Magnolia sinica TaxID=86752 RepID=UPI002658AFE6|nr:uncharacterized protein LOC131236318 isoform X3 [Magnolia sinica]XP_058089416.1 uncharacterized protein LOC131236318 isoform X3 [Magnolia sinica]XP_058089417.1 uncharacterized protein LOC131236318 isoform X3 [Magnolia sinica]
MLQIFFKGWSEVLPILYSTFLGFFFDGGGENEEMPTSKLSGGAQIHYIFQSIFVKSLEVCITLLYDLISKKWIHVMTQLMKTSAPLFKMLLALKVLYLYQRLKGFKRLGGSLLF